jgi:hypothetical protein
MSEQLTVTTAFSITTALEADAIAAAAEADLRALKRMRYLDELAGMGRPHKTKKANWLKFCHSCGCNISHRPKGETFCARCRKGRKR